jgi:hypothetical protein
MTRAASSTVTGAGAPGRKPMTPVSEPGETDAPLDQRLADRSLTGGITADDGGDLIEVPASSAAPDAALPSARV